MAATVRNAHAVIQGASERSVRAKSHCPFGGHGDRLPWVRQIGKTHAARTCFLWIETRAEDYDAGTQVERFPEEFHLRVVKGREGDLKA